MAQQRLTMRQIKEILRLRHDLGLSNRRIAKALKLSKTTVSNYLSRAKAAGFTWPVDENLSDSDIYKRIFALTSDYSNRPKKALPDCPSIHLELKKKGVTLRLLWEEYLEVHPDGYSYTQFCHYYKQWAKTLRLSMRQNHVAGEKMFVDYSGTGIDIIDPKTGEVKTAELFVAVLGASGYTYAEASWSQKSSCWIHSHINAFEYFDGVSQILVPDNLKSGVTKPCRYEPDINLTYQDMVTHYGAVVIPARSKKPKDKAKAENGVLLAQRWILAALRNRKFFSVGEANEAIWELLEKLNNKPMQKIKKSRKELYLTIEKSALKPLPPYKYIFANSS